MKYQVNFMQSFHHSPGGGGLTRIDLNSEYLKVIYNIFPKRIQIYTFRAEVVVTLF